ncbi:amidohydrolase [bacterium]|nr:MAG: amidohydrolase [bacterium]
MRTMIKTLFSAFVFSLISTSLFAQTFAIKGETVYTSAGEPIKNGVVLIKDGKIEQVGTNISIPSGYSVHEAKVVTPGFIDAHSVVGLAGIFNQKHDQDQLETSSPIQPELRAIDAYNAQEALVKFLQEMGITTVHSGHGPGALMSGQTLIAKTTGETVEEAVIKPEAMIAMTIGSAVASNFKSPGTRSKGIAMLRETFVSAQQYAEKMKNKDESKRPARDLKKEAVAKLLSGELTALVTAQTGRDIMTALRLKEEFGFPMVIDGGAEVYTILDEVKKSGVPVIIHPSMMRTYGDGQHATFETAGKVADAGILMAFQSGFEGYVPKTRVITFEAAIAVSNGLAYDKAMKALTIDAAKLLGIDKQIGSLEKGKDADVVLYDGDPFEYTSHVLKVFINGKLVSDKKK